MWGRKCSIERMGAITSSITLSYNVFWWVKCLGRNTITINLRLKW